MLCFTHIIIVLFLHFDLTVIGDVVNLIVNSEQDGRGTPYNCPGSGCNLRGAIEAGKDKYPDLYVISFSSSVSIK